MKIYKKDIQKLLSEISFNPNERGPLSIITETNNTSYWINRAKELISEAQDDKKSYDDLIKKAIRLLCLAVCKGRLDATVQYETNKTRRTGEENPGSCDLNVKT